MRVEPPAARVVDFFPRVREEIRKPLVRAARLFHRPGGLQGQGKTEALLRPLLSPLAAGSASLPPYLTVRPTSR